MLGEQNKKLETDLKISHPQVISVSAARDTMSRDYLDVTFDCASTTAQRLLSSSSDALRSLSFSNSQPRPATPMQSIAAAEMKKWDL